MRSDHSGIHMPSLETARQLAVDAFLFLAQDETHIVHFLNASGIDPAELRTIAREDRTLAAVLEHLLANESLLLVFAANAHHQPSEVAPALARLRRDGDMAGDSAGDLAGDSA
jgi:hypothetical protein